MKTLFEQIIEKHFPEMTSADGVVDRETKMDLLIMERMFDAISEDYHLIDKSKVNVFYQDDDEPENFCDGNDGEFDALGDCIDFGEIMTINKITDFLVKTEQLYGTWTKIDSVDKFYVGTWKDCWEIAKKHQPV